MPSQLAEIASDLRRAPLERLGFRPDDAADTTALIEASSGGVLAAVAVLATELRARVGTFPTSCPEIEPVGEVSVGEIFLLAFLATVDDVRAEHRRRGIDDELSWHSLSDLGQQVWVHRQTYGVFGLHTYEWVAGSSWDANLFWLGRLQFNFKPDPASDRWWISTHIPQTGPLRPAEVDDAFEQAWAFAPQHFADRPVTAFHCESWLLDPQLADTVPGSNLAAFQARWALYGEPYVADDAVLFFVFHRRGDIDLAALPRATRLERGVLDILGSGRHWYAWHGLVPRAR